MLLHEQVFPSWHPYHLNEDADADDSSVEAIAPRDVLAFVRTWYVPANATLAIAGRFDPRATLALVTKYFATLPSSPPPVRPALPAWELGVRVDYAVPLFSAVAAIGCPTPPLGAPGDRALDLVAAVLSGPGGRLQRSLVGRSQTVRTHAAQRSHARASVFQVDAILRDDFASEGAVGDLDRVVASLGHGVTSEELARAKRRLREGKSAALETSLGRAAHLVHASPEADPWELGVYEAIDAPAVAAAARTWLAPGACTEVVAQSVDGAPRHGMVIARTRRKQ